MVSKPFLFLVYLLFLFIYMEVEGVGWRVGKVA